MADSIIGCTTFRDSNNAVLKHEFTFSFDFGGNIPVRSITVMIEASELTNSEDLAEAKILAISKASEIKASILSTMPSSTFPNNTLNGPVSL